MRVALTLVALAGVVHLPIRPAHACRCWGVDRVSPADGTTDVPTNLAEIVITGFWNHGPVTLESATTSVPLGPSGAQMYSYQIERVPVLAPLEPATEYAVKINGATRATITTGTGPDVTPPAPIAIDTFRLARADVDGYSDSCRPDAIDIDAALSGITEPLIDVTLTGGETVQHYVLQYPPGTDVLSQAYCDVKVVVEKGETYCAAIRSRDLAGNLGPPSLACAETRACSDIDITESNAPGDLHTCPLEGTGGCSTSSRPTPFLVVFVLFVILRRRRPGRMLA